MIIKSLKKEKIQTTKVEKVEKFHYEEEYEYSKGYCGRCEKSFSYGDNTKEPTLCPYCVCKRCGRSLMERRRDAYAGKVTLCAPCYYGNYSHGLLNTYTYSSKEPKRQKETKKKVVDGYEYKNVLDYIEKETIVDVNNIDYNEKSKKIIIDLSKENIDSLEDLYENCDKQYINNLIKKIGPSFFDFSTFEDAIYFIKTNNTWLPKEKITFLNNLPIETTVVDSKQELEEFNDIVGFYPNVPMYIKGFPLNMYNNRRKNKINYSNHINIYFNLSLDSSNFKSQYINRGKLLGTLKQYLDFKHYNNTKIKYNIIFLDATYIDDETLIIKYNFNYNQLSKNFDILFNLATKISFYRIIITAYKKQLINKGKISSKWNDTFGSPMNTKAIKKALDLPDNSCIINLPDEIGIYGMNSIDDLERAYIKLGYYDDSYELIKAKEVYYLEEDFEKKHIKKTLEDRKIKKLIHFTSEINIDSIKKYGLLPKSTLKELKIDFIDNDKDRLDGLESGICLTVTNPNYFLLNEYLKRYPDRKYKIIEINPKILMDENKKIIYFDNNAAYRHVKKDANMEIMFKPVVKGQKKYTRLDLEDNITTSTQAEIIYCDKINPEDIIDIYDYAKKESTSY